MSSLQSQRLRKYYNDILEVIEVSMRESEDILMKYINEGERTFTEKKDEIEAQLDSTKSELKKLLIFQQKQLQFQFGSHKTTHFNIEAALRNYEVELTLPIFHAHLEIP